MRYSEYIIQQVKEDTDETTYFYTLYTCKSVAIAVEKYRDIKKKDPEIVLRFVVQTVIEEVINTADLPKLYRR